MSGTNGKAFTPLGDLEAFLRAASLPVTITEAAAPKPKRRRKKHVPIAPAGTVPSGEVEWIAVRRGAETDQRRVTAQTWFFARAAALALFMCEASEIVVVRA
jgi:hypothetical protein